MEKIKKLEIKPIIGKSYGKMICKNAKLFILPLREIDIVEYDLNNGSVRIRENPKDLVYYDMGWGKYLESCENNNLLWMANRMSNYILYIDEDENIRWRKPETLSIDKEADYYSFVGTKFFTEDRLELLVKLETEPKCSDNNKNVGKSIWKRMNE